MKNCAAALVRGDLYQAFKGIWDLDFLVQDWQGIQRIPDSLGWRQHWVCQGFWTEAQLQASHEDVAKQRFIWPAHLPAGVESPSFVEGLVAAGTRHFPWPPVLGGHVFALPLLGKIAQKAGVHRL